MKAVGPAPTTVAGGNATGAEAAFVRLRHGRDAGRRHRRVPRACLPVTPVRFPGLAFVLLAILFVVHPLAAQVCHAAPSASEPPREAQPTSALDAYQLGLQEWKDGQRERALRDWRRAAELDPRSLPPRLALARALIWSDASRASAAMREVSFLVLTDFTAQRWALAHLLIALALGGTLGVFLLAAGLIARHVRAVHHIILEGLRWSLPLRRPAAPYVAWALLALPIAAAVGPVGTLLFWLFLCAFRFGRAERILALICATWVVLLGPALTASAPLWSSAPTGRDALLIERVQREPASTPARAQVGDWLEEQPGSAVPMFLDGLARLDLMDGRGAAASLSGAASGAEIPPAVLETDLGTAAALAGEPKTALAHYRRALKNNPACFEAMYNMGLLQAGEGRFAQADEALDAAARLNLDQLRAIGRSGEASGPRSPVPALWSPAELWAWTLRHPNPPVLPALLSRLLPLRSLGWAAPLTFGCVLLGALVGKRLERLLRARVCYQCGAPVCRRCLVRIDRRAYCRKCGETMGGLETGESTRRLLQTLIEDKPRGIQIGRVLSYAIPGTGAALRGYPVVGAAASLAAGLGLALLAFPLWGRPAVTLPGDPMTTGAIQIGGLLLLALSLGITALGTHAADRRRGSLRAFLERDVDRLAA